MNTDVSKYVRGSVWWLRDDIEDKTQGRRGILRGTRPVLILSVVSNKNGGCTISYVPLSTAKSASKHSDFEDLFYAVSVSTADKTSSYIFCNQIGTATTTQLTGFFGIIEPKKMQEVEEMILRYLNMEEYKKVNPIVDNISNKSRKQSEKQKLIYTIDFEKAILCIETGKIYKSVSDASKENDVTPASISKSIKSKRSTKGKHFVRISDPDTNLSELINIVKGEINND